MNDVERYYVIGVDVGTGSARAGVFDLKGQLMATAKHPITTYRADGARYEQSSDEIWQAVCQSVKQALKQAAIDAHSVLGLSFDATCSMVVVGADNQPLAVDLHGEAKRNVIVWMDQRATKQAERINQRGHGVLQYVGKRISPEMQTPKLLWLKEHLPTTYFAAKHFFDLTDFLTWRASGSQARSICTTACKWTYLAHEKRWDASYFNDLGLADIVQQDFVRIGQQVVAPGTPLAQGLSASAAQQLGLPAGIAVAAGLIDAHAGGVGSVGARGEKGDANPQACLAYVFGTSACTLATSAKKIIVPGVWGPYYSAMLPDMWLNEAGQSAAGAAIDHLIATHPAAGELEQQAKLTGKSAALYLSDQLKARTTSLSDAVFLAQGVHVVPEFLGNRAPFADPEARAAIIGLDMDHSLESLLKLYVAGLCGLAYGLRQIIDAQALQGLMIERIVISGGAGQDPLVRQLLADACGLEVLAPHSTEPVLLGSAMLAALAAGCYSSLQEAMAAMSSFGQGYQANPQVAPIHAQRLHTFTQLQALAKQVRGF